MNRKAIVVWIRQGRRRIIVSTKRVCVREKEFKSYCETLRMSSKGQGGVAQIKVFKPS